MTVVHRLLNSPQLNVIDFVERYQLCLIKSPKLKRIYKEEIFFHEMRWSVLLPAPELGGAEVGGTPADVQLGGAYG